MIDMTPILQEHAKVEMYDIYRVIRLQDIITEIISSDESVAYARVLQSIEERAEISDMRLNELEQLLNALTEDIYTHLYQKTLSTRILDLWVFKWIGSVVVLTLE